MPSDLTYDQLSADERRAEKDHELTHWGWCTECEERRLIHSKCGRCVSTCCECKQEAHDAAKD